MEDGVARRWARDCPDDGDLSEGELPRKRAHTQRGTARRRQSSNITFDCTGDRIPALVRMGRERGRLIGFLEIDVCAPPSAPAQGVGKPKGHANDGAVSINLEQGRGYGTTRRGSASADTATELSRTQLHISCFEELVQAMDSGALAAKHGSSTDLGHSLLRGLQMLSKPSANIFGKRLVACRLGTPSSPSRQIHAVSIAPTTTQCSLYQARIFLHIFFFHAIFHIHTDPDLRLLMQHMTLIGSRKPTAAPNIVPGATITHWQIGQKLQRSHNGGNDAEEAAKYSAHGQHLPRKKQQQQQQQQRQRQRQEKEEEGPGTSPSARGQGGMRAAARRRRKAATEPVDITQIIPSMAASPPPSAAGAMSQTTFHWMYSQEQRTQPGTEERVEGKGKEERMGEEDGGEMATEWTPAAEHEQEYIQAEQDTPPPPPPPQQQQQHQQHQAEGGYRGLGGAVASLVRDSGSSNKTEGPGVNDFLWEQHTTSATGAEEELEPQSFFYCPMLGGLSLHLPSKTHGGIITHDDGVTSLSEGVALISNDVSNARRSGQRILPTLVVVSDVFLTQWRDAFERCTSPLRVCHLYHHTLPLTHLPPMKAQQAVVDSTRKRATAATAPPATHTALATYDVVLTSFRVLSIHRDRLLPRWRRVIADTTASSIPIHRVLNDIADIQAPYRWLFLHGHVHLTPHALLAALRFLGVEPWASFMSSPFAFWDELVVRPRQCGDAPVLLLLHRILRGIALHRTAPGTALAQRTAAAAAAAAAEGWKHRRRDGGGGGGGGGKESRVEERVVAVDFEDASERFVYKALEHEAQKILQTKLPTVLRAYARAMRQAANHARSFDLASFFKFTVLAPTKIRHADLGSFLAQRHGGTVTQWRGSLSLAAYDVERALRLRGFTPAATRAAVKQIPSSLRGEPASTCLLRASFFLRSKLFDRAVRTLQHLRAHNCLKRRQRQHAERQRREEELGHGQEGRRGQAVDGIEEVQDKGGDDGELQAKGEEKHETGHVEHEQHQERCAQHGGEQPTSSSKAVTAATASSTVARALPARTASASTSNTTVSSSATVTRDRVRSSTESVDDCRVCVEELSCPVCLDVCRRPMLLPCWHVLCHECVACFMRQYKTERSGRCPVCKHAFRISECTEIIPEDEATPTTELQQQAMPEPEVPQLTAEDLSCLVVDTAQRFTREVHQATTIRIKRFYPHTVAVVHVNGNRLHPRDYHIVPASSTTSHIQFQQPQSGRVRVRAGAALYDGMTRRVPPPSTAVPSAFLQHVDVSVARLGGKLNAVVDLLRREHASDPTRKIIIVSSMPLLLKMLEQELALSEVSRQIHGLSPPVNGGMLTFRAFVQDPQLAYLLLPSKFLHKLPRFVRVDTVMEIDWISDPRHRDCVRRLFRSDVQRPIVYRLYRKGTVEEREMRQAPLPSPASREQIHAYTARLLAVPQTSDGAH